MPPSTAEAVDGQVPPPLPAELQPCNWLDLEEEDALKIWQHYEDFLFKHGYHIMGSSMYNTLGTGVTKIPPPAADPFHPNDTEAFIHYYHPKDLRSTRTFSTWQPSVDICFGIDGFQRQVVFKAVLHQSTELEVLRLLNSPSLRANKCNRVIPVLSFLKTHDFVIIVMPGWGFSWDAPPCGNMTTRGEMAIKFTECLEWLHQLGIAHGDIHPRNILISHADSRNWSALPENDFRQTSNIEYAFIDLGSAHIFTPGTPPIATPITTPPSPIHAPEQDAEGTKPIDVFAADVYNLGKTLETELTAALKKYGEEYVRRQKEYQEYRNILSAMTDPQPGNRPTAAEALATLYVIFQPNPHLGKSSTTGQPLAN
ncbi:hypothetical protein M422DRAFT_777720 [Sphaerobolus stellatus SS14]|nr:hypothetical protein M422DRAFT_777720 [Sphaerobolus stellatus SS14]